MNTNTNISPPEHRYVPSTRKTGVIKARLIPIQPKEKVITDIVAT